MLLNLIVSGLAVLIASYLLPGVKVNGYFTALIVAVILGIVNAILKPILIIITLPINILTLGLFTFVINALMIKLVAAFVPGFSVAGFWWALLFSLVLSLVNSFLHSFT